VGARVLVKLGQSKYCGEPKKPPEIVAPDFGKVDRSAILLKMIKEDPFCRTECCRDWHGVKVCCALLRDKSIEKMPTDLVGKIYKPVDLKKPKTVGDALHKWLRDDLGLDACEDCPK
jgi:hypothetical protein